MGGAALRCQEVQPPPAPVAANIRKVSAVKTSPLSDFMPLHQPCHGSRAFRPDARCWKAGPGKHPRQAPLWQEYNVFLDGYALFKHPQSVSAAASLHGMGQAAATWRTRRKTLLFSACNVT